MRIITLVALACVAACSSDHGVALTVEVPAGVDSVELMIAPGECTPGDQIPKCDSGIAWDTATTKHRGQIFILDSDTATVADVGADGTARFRLEAVGDSGSAARIAVIGYQAGKAVGVAMLEDVTIPLHRAEVWQVTLEALPDIARDDAVDVDRMHVWKRTDPTLSRCLVVERVDAGQPSFEFLVPPGDTDCDDAAPECDDFWYLYQPSSAKADCLTTGPLDPGACTLGSRGCADGKASANTCMQTAPEVCTVDPICASCLDSFDVACISTALETNFTDTGSTMPHVTCSFPYQLDNGQPCTSGFPNDTGLIVIPDAAFAAGNTCETIGFIPLVTPVPPPSQQLTLGGATFQAHKLSTGKCAFKVQWSGTATAGVPPERGFLDVKIHETGKHLLIPFQIGFTMQSGCPSIDNSMLICSLRPTGGIPLNPDHVFDCAK